MLSTIIAYFRFQYHFHRLSQFKDEDDYWLLTSEMVEHIWQCYKVIPADHFDRLTLPALQSIKMPFHTSSVVRWKEIMGEVIPIVEQGETFSSIHNQWYQYPVDISLNRYLMPANIQMLRDTILEIRTLLAHLLQVMSQQPKLFSYYLRHCGKLIEDGVNVLTSLLIVYKRNQFYVKQK